MPDEKDVIHWNLPARDARYVAGVLQLGILALRNHSALMELVLNDAQQSSFLSALALLSGTPQAPLLGGSLNDVLTDLVARAELSQAADVVSPFLRAVAAATPGTHLKEEGVRDASQSPE